MRRCNLVGPDEMPFNIGKLTTYEPEAEFDSGDYPALFEAALREIKWQELQAIQGREIDGWYHGVGLSCFSESGAGGATEQARIRLAEDGTIDLFVGATNSGQGHETVFAQVCADILQLPLEKIRVKSASTDELEAGTGSWHSRSAVMSGNAVHQTAHTFLESIRVVAMDYLGRPNVELAWNEGAFVQEGSRDKVTLGVIAKHVAERGEAIDVTDTFVNETRKPFSYGTNAAHVAVDPRTGRVKILDFVAMEDIGTVLNPLIAHGQSEGSIVQGLGGVFLENMMYDDSGQLITASFADYLMPTATDFPAIRGKFLNLAPAPGNPLGAKGGGEGGLVAVAGAVGNAISAALASFNVQVRELPVSPPRLWEMTRKAGK
jgi:carbon-monoxide dehydrogenase large subunit